MTDEILNAIEAEAQAFALSIQDDVVGCPQVMTVTNFKDIDMATYTMPLVLIYMIDAPESSRYIGGMKRMDWVMAFSSYHYDPNADLNDITGYPASLQIVIDKLMDHFMTGLTSNSWLTAGMTNIWQKYSFQMTFSGVGKADSLGKDGLLLGWKVMFDTISLYSGTSNVQPSSATLLHVVQQPYP